MISMHNVYSVNICYWFLLQDSSDEVILINGSDEDELIAKTNCSHGNQRSTPRNDPISINYVISLLVTIYIFSSTHLIISLLIIHRLNFKISL